MTTATDQTQDTNLQGLHALDIAYGLPSLVKQASIEQIRGTDQLEPHMFADVTRRQYPCHTAPATWVSAAYFFQKRAEYPKPAAEHITRRIKDSAMHFGIAKQVNDLAEKIAAANIVDEAQLPDSAFAIVMEYENGSKERHYPMRNAREVKTAADYLTNYRSQLTYRDRQKIADKVLEKAAAFGADIGNYRDSIERMSGIGVCAAKTAAELVRSRVPYIKLESGELADQFEKLAVRLEEKSANQVWSSYDLVASVVDQADREYHLTSLYGNQLEYPEDVLFSVSTKVAAEQSDELIGTLTGNYYKKADLQRVPVNLFGDTLGDDFVNAISTANAWVDTEKLAMIVPTLPIGDAELFDAAVMEAGIRPFATKTASDARKIAPADMEEMASQHKTTGAGGLWAGIRE